MKRCTLAVTSLFAALGTVASVAVFATVGQGQAPATKQAAVKVFALIWIARHPPSILADPPTKTDKDEFDTFRRQQAFLVKNRFVLSKTLDDPKVAKLQVVKRQADPIAWLEQNLVVDFPYPDDGAILRISMSGLPSEEIATIVNQITRAYLREAEDNNFKRRNARELSLRDLFEENERRLKDKKEIVSSFRQRQLEGRDARLDVMPDSTDLKRELLRLKLAQAGVKVRLEHAANKESAALLKEELAVLAAQENVVRDDLTTLAKETKRLEKGFDFTRLGDEINLAKTIERRLIMMLAELEMESNAPLRVGLLQEAVVASGPAEVSKTPK